MGGIKAVLRWNAVNRINKLLEKFEKTTKFRLGFKNYSNQNVGRLILCEFQRLKPWHFAFSCIRIPRRILRDIISDPWLRRAESRGCRSYNDILIA